MALLWFLVSSRELGIDILTTGTYIGKISTKQCTYSGAMLWRMALIWFLVSSRELGIDILTTGTYIGKISTKQCTYSGAIL